MIYIPLIKEQIEALIPRWIKGNLTEAELKSFYKLIDEIVREARRSRSDHLLEHQQKPEDYLLNLFKPRIKSKVLRFLTKHSKYMKQEPVKKKDCPLDETNTFQTWMGYAMLITRSIILGDSTERESRKREIQPYLDKCDSDDIKYLYVNNKWIKAHRDALLGEHGTHKKDISLLKTPEALAKADKELKEFSQQKAGTGLGVVNRPGFLIRDATAIEAADELAKETDREYDPDYKEKRLEDLSTIEEEMKWMNRDWDAGKYKDRFNNKKQFDQWVEAEVLGYSSESLEEEFQRIRMGNPNPINFLFKSGILYQRLVDLHKFKERQRAKKKIDDENSMPNNPRQEEDEAADRITFKQNLKGIRPHLTDIQKPVFDLWAKELSQSEIASELGCTKQNVSKHIKNIKKEAKNHPHLNPFRP